MYTSLSVFTPWRLMDSLDGLLGTTCSHVNKKLSSLVLNITIFWSLSRRDIKLINCDPISVGLIWLKLSCASHKLIRLTGSAQNTINLIKNLYSRMATTYYCLNVTTNKIKVYKEVVTCCYRIYLINIIFQNLWRQRRIKYIYINQNIKTDYFFNI